ncbi:POK9 protein, partial [Sagittarius serpentarius]|nr:POK9 protein [Sagittarius serpentarius]
AGSAGVDPATAVEITLWDSTVQCIPTATKGPLGYGLSALLLGRSSTRRKGLFVLPGVIDTDFTGQIQIMVWTPIPPVNIPAASRIAQLVPFKACVPHALEQNRGEGSFGSTGEPDVFWALEIEKRKPTLKIRLMHPRAQPEVWECGILVDTGADVAIIA